MGELKKKEGITYVCIVIYIMKTNIKRDGFYMNITPEERNIINQLQERYAVNISGAFKLFLKQLLKNTKEQYEKNWHI